MRRRTAERRGVRREPAGEVRRLLIPVERGAAEDLGEAHAVHALHRLAAGRVDEHVVDAGRAHRREHAPGEPQRAPAPVEGERCPPAVGEARLLLGAGRAAGHGDGRGGAAAPARRGVRGGGPDRGLRRPQRGAADGRTGDGHEPAGARHRGAEPGVGDRDPVHALLPRELLDAARGAARDEPEAVEVARPDAEGRGVVAHVAECDGGRVAAARAGEEAVELADAAQRARAVVDRQRPEAAEPLAQPVARGLRAGRARSRRRVRAGVEVGGLRLGRERGGRECEEAGHRRRERTSERARRCGRRRHGSSSSGHGAACRVKRRPAHHP